MILLNKFIKCNPYLRCLFNNNKMYVSIESLRHIYDNSQNNFIRGISIEERRFRYSLFARGTFHVFERQIEDEIERKMGYKFRCKVSLYTKYTPWYCTHEYFAKEYRENYNYIKKKDMSRYNHNKKERCVML